MTARATVALLAVTLVDQKSLELDPGNTNAVEMIERMRSGGAE